MPNIRNKRKKLIMLQYDSDSDQQDLCVIVQYDIDTQQLLVHNYLETETSCHELKVCLSRLSVVKFIGDEGTYAIIVCKVGIESSTVTNPDWACSTSRRTINLFTNRTPGKHILTTSPAQKSIDVESPSFTGKYFRVMPVFGDLRVLETGYLCHNWPVQQLIARHPAFIQQVCHGIPGLQYQPITSASPWSSSHGLAVLVMIAQIRAGLWSSLIILDPNTIIVSILNRFGLLSFFCGEVENCPYEGVHLLSMVEELLYVLMTILGERVSATKLPFQRAIRHLECILKDVLSHFHAPGSTLTTASYPANKWHPLAHHEVNPQASTQLLVLQGEENDPIFSWTSIAWVVSIGSSLVTVLWIVVYSFLPVNTFSNTDAFIDEVDILFPNLTHAPRVIGPDPLCVCRFLHTLIPWKLVNTPLFSVKKRDTMLAKVGIDQKNLIKEIRHIAHWCGTRCGVFEIFLASAGSRRIIGEMS
ncbi:uncharacterized protein F5147DRAFT_819920 [Suillus discolor]|uniref:Uncharacterized protein n=1 Tax=Suillus discolor TaxID=1912936 RepID=A0A9P7EXD1_9AGAM|nr:uncharacterized protein F5147DRAFT_819920 [Suillus discolor]KAG2094386.1 hypothetical protein F5147DRAFT_819920 [Suillus discolor]